MNTLTLNSFPAEIHPPTLQLPVTEYESWEASTRARSQELSKYRLYRYPMLAETGNGRIRVVLISGPAIPAEIQSEKIDVGNLQHLGVHLIESALANYLESRGMTIRRGRFETLALRQADATLDRKIKIYSGISFKASRPFREQRHSFVVTVQWVARAVFSETLANAGLQAIARGLSVIYTPSARPEPDLAQFENRYLGHVSEIFRDDAEVICRDDVRRRVPLSDLSLEAHPEAIRIYENSTGSRQQSSRIWRKLQQVSKVLTPEGRRNPSVLRDRLHAIRNVMASSSKEQLVISTRGYAETTVTIGLSPVKVEI